ncbi:hypothetical protein BKA70DRAFT_1239232 [Coprinopsis sp. MPI-PUGE-AT-0042]|nr:hypothetical protein BKA70DRAFT_1239232 [Coprinopsis sp. MPI-PUGE-AT-0042]
MPDSKELQPEATPNSLSESRRSNRRTLRRYTPIPTTRSTRARSLASDPSGSYRAISPAALEGVDSTTVGSEDPFQVEGSTAIATSTTISQRDQNRIMAELESLKATIERQKRLLRSRMKSLEWVKEEVAQIKQQRAEVQQELDEKEEELVNSKKNEEQYRNWWLNEIQFTKLLLNKVPNPNRDINLVRASQAHYLGHY